jgi:p-cumate 2,3-dioxygenase beta subunit
VSINSTSIYGETSDERALRAEVEAFMYYEATLLDEWRLEEWAGFLTEDVRYLVPSLDTPQGDHRDTLFLIADDYLTLQSRLSQLKGRTAWVENPLSRTRRLVTNIRARSHDNGEILVRANFAIWRFHQGASDIYVGQYQHTLVRNESNEFRIKVRKSILDMETLRPHGRLSIIL